MKACYSDSAPASSPAEAAYSGLAEVLFTEEQLRRRVADLGRQITRDFAGRELLVVAMLKGAVVFASDLVRRIDLPLRLDFISISRFQRDGHPSGIRLLKDLDCDVAGRDVLVVGEIIDTGFTTNYLLKNLQSRNPASVSVCTLLDRDCIRIIDVPIAYRGFSVDPDYVVGYGLDCAEEYRALPFVAKVLPPSAREPLG